MNKNAYMKQLRQRREELGLCRECGEKVSYGSTRCAVCLLKDMLRKRRWRQAHPNYEREHSKQVRCGREENNQCIRCGAPLIEDECRYCMNCKIYRIQKISLFKGGYNEVNRKTTTQFAQPVSLR